MAKVKFKRKTTEEIENLEIEDGSLIYDIETGKTYMDYNGERISTGGGNSGSAGIYISETEPTEEDASLWINPTNSIAKYKINDEWFEVETEQILLETSEGNIPTKLYIEDNILNNLGTEVVDSLEGDQHDLAPSVHIIKNNIKNVIGNASDTNNGLMSSDFYKKNQLTNIWFSGGSSHNLTINDYATIIAFGTYDSKNFIWVLRLDPNTISTVFSYGTLPSNWTRTSKGLNIPSASNTNVNLIGQIKSYI